ncbi:MAG: hypothetical protein GY859_38975 [Desulfobacterales bacterium]|nr:hypothetical protein [Desulfobacterales bacterium]
MMNIRDTDIEALIPHRGRMKLIDEVVEIDEEAASTAAEVTDQWPLFTETGVSPIVLIELAAQTAGVHVGWWERRKSDDDADGKGWIVGVKKATFFLEELPLHARIITRVRVRLKMDNYLEFIGESRVGDAPAGEIALQVLWAKVEDSVSINNQ